MRSPAGIAPNPVLWGPQKGPLTQASTPLPALEAEGGAGSAKLLTLRTMIFLVTIQGPPRVTSSKHRMLPCAGNGVAAPGAGGQHPTVSAFGDFAAGGHGRDAPRERGRAASVLGLPRSLRARRGGPMAGRRPSLCRAESRSGTRVRHSFLSHPFICQRTFRLSPQRGRGDVGYLACPKSLKRSVDGGLPRAGGGAGARFQ